MRSSNRVPVPEATVAADWTVLGALAALAAVLFGWSRRRRNGRAQ